MIYTSGVISDIEKEETLEEIQDNKLAIVCEKLELKQGESLLDIGCGWGTLARFASVNFGARATGITLGRNQTAWGNKALRDVGISEEQSKVLCMDYRDIPVPEGGYDKISCLEMAEHVGVRKFKSFLKQVYDMLDDDGVFFLQIAGLRKPWQYDDLVWGLFMNKYIFPGADASTPLGFFVDSLEAAGWEIKGIDTIGVHYSATLWRWYRNWLANKDKVIAKYGNRWYRVSLKKKISGVALWKGSNIDMKSRSGSTFWLTQPSPLVRVARPATRSCWSRISTPPTVLRAFAPNTV
jgi:sphingolipid C9-methyltransferase